MRNFLIFLWCLLLIPALRATPIPADTPAAPGFRGIWFTLGQKSAYGDKYSGGLGTYTANHVPMAIHHAATKRTYFTWGAAPAADKRLLQIAISYYDHQTGTVVRPVIVMDKSPVDDPHDNASLSIDEQGHLWVFVSGRSKTRLGRIYRSLRPHDISAWKNRGDSEFTYPQPWWIPGKGFFHTYTRYTPGRELYFRTSADGITWSQEQKLAGLEGHYQTSECVNGRILTAFNRHPQRNVDRRTDLYFMQSHDMGRTWTTAAGEKITIPLTKIDSPARIRDYAAEKKNVYIHDTTIDAAGHPVILYLTSGHHQPGPDAGPRTWHIARWTGTAWSFNDVTTSTHNYDTGSLFTENDAAWQIIGPTAQGPQPWGAGGEMASWISKDHGVTWQQQRAITANSPRNHSYARRPRHAHPDFHAYWADGDADSLSPSHLYFTNEAGDKVWELPYTMTDDFAKPRLLPH